MSAYTISCVFGARLRQSFVVLVCSWSEYFTLVLLRTIACGQ